MTALAPPPACLMDRRSNCRLHVDALNPRWVFLKERERDCLFLSLALSWPRPPAGRSAFMFLCREAQAAAEWQQLSAAGCCCTQLAFPALTSQFPSASCFSSFRCFHESDSDCKDLPARSDTLTSVQVWGYCIALFSHMSTACAFLNSAQILNASLMCLRGVVVRFLLILVKFQSSALQWNASSPSFKWYFNAQK